MRLIRIGTSHAMDYYFQPDPFFCNDSSWFGELADMYHLVGSPVSKGDFANLISGNTLNGIQVIKDGIDSHLNQKRLVAVDIVFSPPKSVSIAALHLGDRRVIENHEIAVRKTLRTIEKGYTYVRKTENGMTTAHRVGEGIYAVFPHSISREYDPQLHTHCLLINHAVTPYGNKALWYYKLYADQVFINRVYQNEFAKALTQSGCKLDIEQNGKWELAGFERQWIETFSKRSRQLNVAQKEMKSAGIYSFASEPKHRQLAAVISRTDKNSSITEAELKLKWEKEVPRKMITESMEKSKSYGPFQIDEMAPYTAVTHALNSHLEKDAVFSDKQVLEQALKASVGSCTLKEISSELTLMKMEKRILPVYERTNWVGLTTCRYTSDHIKETEEAFMERIVLRKDSCAALMSLESVNRYLEKLFDYYTDHQKNAIRFLLTSETGISVVIGDRDTGKAFAVKAVKEILEMEKSDRNVFVLHYSDDPSKEMQNITGIGLKTFNDFTDKRGCDPSKDIFIVCNEHHFLRDHMADSFLKKAEAENARIVFVSDFSEMKTVSSGRIVKDLEGMGVPHVQLSEKQPHKAVFLQKSASLINGFQKDENRKGLDAAFELFGNNDKLVENRSMEALKKRIVNEFVSRKNREEVLVIAPTEKHRMDLNRMIRSELIKNGMLDSVEHPVEVRIPQKQQGLERYFSKNYSHGQQAFIEISDSKIHGVERFDAWVIGRGDEKYSLMVLAENGKTYSVSLRENHIQMIAYDTQLRGFCSGDRIVFLKNEKRLGIETGMTGTLERIDDIGLFHIRTNDRGREIVIDPKKYLYLDHGYAVSNGHGQVCREVFYLADVNNARENKTRSLSTGLSKARESITLLSNDMERLKEQFKSGRAKSASISHSRCYEISKSTSRQYDRDKEKEVER